MTTKNSDALRSQFITELFQYFENKGEDVGMITSNCFNMPYVFGDDECAVEIVVKVPKYDGDELYAKRDEYKLKCDSKRKKAEEKASKEAKKKAKDADKASDAE